ncbi:MAG: VWA domain-containing protein [Deltaproteobacteria bacterium]|nr:VWA domain-containing protein [Deltaproteobacteria bacterium]
MSIDLNDILSRLEKFLSSIGLPAGPDRAVNHKTLLGLLVGLTGGLTGWLLSEPYQENFSFWRDFFILLSVGFFICLFVMSVDGILERNPASLFTGVLRAILYSLVILVPATLATKLAIEQVQGHTDSPKALKILVLDVSGSMRGKPLASLKTAVEAYISTVETMDKRGNNLLACVAFSDHAKVIAPPTDDYKSVIATANQMSAFGATRMDEALLQTRKLFENYGETKSTFKSQRQGLKSFISPRHEIILITDGKPTGGYSPVLESLPFFIFNSIPINTVGTGLDYDRALLERISLKTGGRFTAVDDIAGLVPILEEYARQGLAQAGEYPAGLLSHFSRGIGWAIIGVAIGICAAIPRRTFRAFVFGATGGLVGGLLGAFLFEIFQYVLGGLGVTSGIVNRFVGFCVLGAAIGFTVPFAESISKLAWIRVIAGHQVGRLIILDRSPVTLGSGSDSDITIVGDTGIASKHVQIIRSREKIRLETIGDRALNVDGKEVHEATICPEDTFMVGATKFLYLTKMTLLRG